MKNNSKVEGLIFITDSTIHTQSVFKKPKLISVGSNQGTNGLLNFAYNS